MRRGGPRQLIWYVRVCDYEACWPIAFFDSKEKAESHCERYQLQEGERKKYVVMAEVF